MISLEQQVALVFGGGSLGGETNNGLATSLAFAEAGAKVALVDANPEAVQGALDRFEKEFPGSTNGRVIGVTANVTNPDEVRAAVEATIAAFGQIDVLHNNVGIARMGGPLEMELDEWNLVMNVNLTSVFLTTKYVLPHMLERGKGSIINVASVGGMRYIGYNYPSYTATKAGLIGYTQTIALEYAAKGIRANTISPGYIETPMMYRQISGAYDSVEAMVAARHALSPTGKMGVSQDVARAAVFLASDAAQYINGVCLPVDGGLIQRATEPARDH
ncbi:SDR family NAD(P)-dependent oxidoreductase [Leucobacter chinensis]|uniref:SDR family NAD(P)-dependent oxidoreductase n=1 Tax=Leucobacter chinensis TaxID=2851010 RepID=UPI001C24FA32|nr:SDR family NAD(P)-dependent oxidoreductase [Leucobacter chinensis]